jgi:hypothetical protein
MITVHIHSSGKGGYHYKRVSNRESASMVFMYYKMNQSVNKIAQILHRSTRIVSLKVNNCRHLYGYVKRDMRHLSYALKLHWGKYFKLNWRLIAKRVQEFLSGSCETLEEAFKIEKIRGEEPD